MAIVRAHVETVEVIGLDEAYLELTGPARSARVDAPRARQEIERAHRARLLDRDRAEQARGQGRLRRREAARVRGPHPRAGLRAVRGLAVRARARGSARRPPSGCARSGSTRSASSPPRRRRSSPQRFGRGFAAELQRRARFEDDDAGHAGAQGRLRIARDHVRPRHRRPAAAGGDPADDWSSELCTTLERQRRGGRTIGIKIRLDDFSTHTRARTLAEPVSSPDRVGPVALDLLRRFARAAAGAPARGARGRPRALGLSAAEEPARRSRCDARTGTQYSAEASRRRDSRASG